MSELVTVNGAEAGLRSIQGRLRELAANYPWIADAVRAAFFDFIALTRSYNRKKERMRAEERELLRKLLACGRLVDQAVLDGGPALFASFEGLCPVDLARQYEKYPDKAKMPDGFQRRAAKQALGELDDFVKYNSPSTPEAIREEMAATYRSKKASGKYLSKTWHLTVARPHGWEEPPNPNSLCCQELRRFSEQEYRTIALYYLGGLADLGAHRPIVPEPGDTEDFVTNSLYWLHWRGRLPTTKQEWDRPSPALCVEQLPLDAAEQLLACVERWVDDRIPSNNETPTKTPQSTIVPPAITKRPVHISKAAKVVYVRSDFLLRKLRSARRHVDDSQRPATAELDDIIACYPRCKKRLLAWADQEYPLPE